MAGRASFRRARAVLGAEFSSIRKSDPDLDPLDIAGFTLPTWCRPARWWVAFGPLPIIAAIWAYEAWRHGGFTVLREFLSDDPPVTTKDVQ